MWYCRSYGFTPSNLTNNGPLIADVIVEIDAVTCKQWIHFVSVVCPRPESEQARLLIERKPRNIDETRRRVLCWWNPTTRTVKLDKNVRLQLVVRIHVRAAYHRPIPFHTLLRRWNVLEFKNFILRIFRTIFGCSSRGRITLILTREITFRLYQCIWSQSTKLTDGQTGGWMTCLGNTKTKKEI